MVTLLVLRHAKSSWKDASVSDHDRPLNTRGRRDAPRIGDLIARLDLVPDVVISSTAARTRATVGAALERVAYRGEILYDEALYLADPSTIVDVVRGYVGSGGARLMVVGHNPGLEQLVYDLTGRHESFPTAAFAQIELPIDAWEDLRLETSGRLVGLWRPKEIE
jgi:phosphohistidine phosphatase